MRRLALALLPPLGLIALAAAQAPTPSAVPVLAAPAAVSLVIPLNAETLRGVPVVTATFVRDLLYKRDVRVQARRLDDVLGRNVPELERLAAAGYTVTFRCLDGYAPKARLADLLGQGGLLAFADAEAGETRWHPVTYRDKALNAESIGQYLNWPRETAARKPVPWGVVALELAPGR